MYVNLPLWRPDKMTRMRNSKDVSCSGQYVVGWAINEYARRHSSQQQSSNANPNRLLTAALGQSNIPSNNVQDEESRRQPEGNGYIHQEQRQFASEFIFVEVQLQQRGLQADTESCLFARVILQTSGYLCGKLIALNYLARFILHEGHCRLFTQVDFAFDFDNAMKCASDYTDLHCLKFRDGGANYFDSTPRSRTYQLSKYVKSMYTNSVLRNSTNNTEILSQLQRHCKLTKRY